MISQTFHSNSKALSFKQNSTPLASTITDVSLLVSACALLIFAGCVYFKISIFRALSDEFVYGASALSAFPLSLFALKRIYNATSKSKDIYLSKEKAKELAEHEQIDLPQQLQSLDYETATAIHDREETSSKIMVKEEEEDSKIQVTPFSHAYLEKPICDYIRITVVASDVKKNPSFYLHKFISYIHNNSKKFSITFLNDDLSNMISADGGGVTRTFLSDMLAGILEENNGYFLSSNAHLPLPLMRTENKKPSQLFEKLGHLMMYCFCENKTKAAAQKLCFGMFVDPIAIDVALRFSSQELSLPFEKLLPQRKIQLLKLLDAEQQDNSEIDIWINNINDHSLPARNFLDSAGFENTDTSSPQQLVGLLKEYKNEKSQESQRLREAQLRGIFYLAKGMNSHHPIQGIRTEDFINSVQGSNNRMFLIETLSEPRDTEINKKFNWLIDWILDETTSQKKINQFIKFSVGCDGIPAGCKISVNGHKKEYGPFPRAHTCGYVLTLCEEKSESLGFNDHTKENFIQCLETVMVDPHYTAL